jgi:hypothetical protein
MMKNLKPTKAEALTASRWSAPGSFAAPTPDAVKQLMSWLRPYGQF